MAKGKMLIMTNFFNCHTIFKYVNAYTSWKSFTNNQLKSLIGQSDQVVLKPLVPNILFQCVFRLS